MNSVKVRESIRKYIVQNGLEHVYIDPHVQDVSEWNDTTLENLELKDNDDVKEFMEFVEDLDEEDFVKVCYLADIGQSDYRFIMKNYYEVYVHSGSLEDAAKDEIFERFSEISGYSDLERYINYEAYANDMLNSGCWYEYEGYVILNADAY